MFGLAAPSCIDVPRLENVAIKSYWSKAPTE